MGFLVRLNVNSRRDLTVTIVDQDAGRSSEKILLDVMLPLNTDTKLNVVSDIDDYCSFDYCDDDGSFFNAEEYSSTTYLEDIEGEQEVYFSYNANGEISNDDAREIYLDTTDYAYEHDNYNNNVSDSSEMADGHFEEIRCSSSPSVLSKEAGVPLDESYQFDNQSFIRSNPLKNHENINNLFSTNIDKIVRFPRNRKKLQVKNGVTSRHSYKKAKFFSKSVFEKTRKLKLLSTRKTFSSTKRSHTKQQVAFCWNMRTKDRNLIFSIFGV